MMIMYLVDNGNQGEILEIFDYLNKSIKKQMSKIQNSGIVVIRILNLISKFSEARSG